MIDAGALSHKNRTGEAGKKEDNSSRTVSCGGLFIGNAADGVCAPRRRHQPVAVDEKRSLPHRANLS
jgi:hypothetical protein